MDASVTDSLAALRDIHLPAPVSFWPLAPGWWATAGLLLAVVLCVILVLRARRRRRDGWNQAAVRELTHLEAAFAEAGERTNLAAGLSSLLRRTALARYPDKEVAALHGDEWFDVLCRDSDPHHSRSQRVARELTQAAYRGDLDVEGSPDEWIAFAHSWIEEAA